MLSNTITLTLGAGNDSVVFNVASRNGNESVYYADSPNSDLAGRRKLRVSHETTKAGIVRSLVQISFPQKNAEGIYDSSITANVTLNRPATADLADVDYVLEAIQEIWAVTDFRSDIGNAES